MQNWYQTFNNDLKKESGFKDFMMGALISAVGMVVFNNLTPEQVSEKFNVSVENVESALRDKGFMDKVKNIHNKSDKTENINSFISRQEGFRANAYPDHGKWAIGYGSQMYENGSPVKQGDTITEPRAKQLMEYHKNRKQDFLSKTIPYWNEMSELQQSALTSFAYNFGEGFYNKKGFETISKALKNKEWENVADAFLLYNKASGKTLEGLIKRRQEERAMWLNGISA